MIADVIPNFVGAMEAVGVRPVEPIAQRLLAGELIRFRCEGDKPGRANGWARLFFDGVPAGAFGNYRLGVSERWRSGGGRVLSLNERRAWAEEVRSRKAARDAEQRAVWEEVAAISCALWDAAGEPLASHEYLRAKRIAGEGLRQSGSALLVPMRDAAGRLWNVQRVYPNGRKVFGPPGRGRGNGGRTEGLFWRCGEPDAVLCVGEGAGTMAAVRRATGHAVAASITGANLEPVARELRAAWPGLDLIICADDDRALVDHPQIKRNLGLDYARAAALAVGGRVAVPGEQQ